MSSPTHNWHCAMRTNIKSLASKIESAGASHPPYDGNILSFCRGGYYHPAKVSWWLDSGGYGIGPTELITPIVEK